MWYYVLIIISVVMFGGGFGLQDMYRKKRGSGFKISMESTCIGALAGLVVLLAIDGFAFEFTPFTLFMASLVAINNMAFTFCAFKALDYINLSLFSLFAMLGGMPDLSAGDEFLNRLWITIRRSCCCSSWGQWGHRAPQHREFPRWKERGQRA